MRYYFFILAVLLLFHTHSQNILLTPLLPASAFQNEFYQVRFRVRNLVGARFQFKNVPSFFTVSSEGLISGVPTKKGLYPIEVTFFNDTYRDTKEVIIEVRRGTKLQQYSNSEFQQQNILEQNKLKVKQQYQFTYNEGDELNIDIKISDGVSPYRYEVIYMPGELQFNNKTGGISGMFGKYGEYVLGIRVRDSRNSQVQVLIKVIVNMRNVLGSLNNVNNNSNNNKNTNTNANSNSNTINNNNSNNNNGNKLVFRQRSLIQLSFLNNNNNSQTKNIINSNANNGDITTIKSSTTGTSTSTTGTTTPANTTLTSSTTSNNVIVNNSSQQKGGDVVNNSVNKQSTNTYNNNLGAINTNTQGGAINIINNSKDNQQPTKPITNNQPSTTLIPSNNQQKQPIIPQSITKSAQSDKKSTQIIPTQNILNKNITTNTQTINIQKIQKQKDLLNKKLQISKTQLKQCYDNVSTYRTTLDNLLNSYNQQFNKVDTFKNQLQQLKTKSQRTSIDLTQKLDKLKIFLTQKTQAEQQYNRSLLSYDNVNFAYNGSLTNINKNLQDINKKQQQIDYHKKELDSLYKVLDQTLMSKNQLEQHKNQLNQQIKNGIGLANKIDTTKVNFGGCQNQKFNQKSIGVGQVKKAIDKTYLLTNNHFITFGDCTEHTIAKPGDFIQWKGYLWKGSVSALTIKKLK